MYYVSIKSSVGDNLTKHMLHKCWICLWLYLDGDGGGKGTHVSLFLVVMKLICLFEYWKCVVNIQESLHIICLGQNLNVVFCKTTSL